jgi:hypothetical protein
MTGPARTLSFLAALVGSALLMWKGVPALLTFLHTVVTSTISADAVFEPVLPSFLYATLGVILLATSQVTSLLVAAPRPKLLGLLRSASILAAAILQLMATAGISKAFSSLQVSAGVSPESLMRNLSELIPLIYGAITFLGVSAFLGLVTTQPAPSKERAHGLRVAESGAWVLSSILLAGFAWFYGQIDKFLLQTDHSGAADPAELAQLISNILIGQMAWAATLIPIALLGLLYAILTPSIPGRKDRPHE